MKFPYFDGKRDNPITDGYTYLPSSRRGERFAPERYNPDKGLIDAVNVALLMEQPLLLTGEPGTGKTQLAYRVAWELGFSAPLKFETKSTSISTDLFYHYNMLAQFRAAQIKDETRDPVDFITYNALGIAIICSHNKEEFQYINFLPKSFTHKMGRRSVVLIDEIDKAPRDFPNDLLNEIEDMYFRIPEFENVQITVNTERKPIVIITSNSEKHLPDAFLRRCVFYHIDFPKPERMREIVEKRLKDLKNGNDSFISDTIELFYQLRDPNRGIKKRPTTAELLVWFVALRKISHEENPLKNKDNVLNTLGILIKSKDDLEIAIGYVKEWFKK